MPKPVSLEELTEVVPSTTVDYVATFSAEDKRRILNEADASAEPGELAALLRRDLLAAAHPADKP